MFLVCVNKNRIVLKRKETLTAGSVNAYDVQFVFNDDWEGMERIAVFRAGSTAVSIALTEDNRCTLPWECTQRSNTGRTVFVGVYGQIDGEVVLPTTWADLGAVKKGVELGEEALPNTPELADQLLAQVASEREAAEQAAISAVILVLQLLLKRTRQVASF